MHLLRTWTLKHMKNIVMYMRCTCIASTRACEMGILMIHTMDFVNKPALCTSSLLCSCVCKFQFTFFTLVLFQNNFKALKMLF